MAVTAGYVSGPLASGISLVLFGHLRAEDDPDVAARRYRRSLWACFAASAGTALAIGAAAPWLLRLAFGEPFVAAATPLRLLLVGMVARDVASVASSRVQALGRPEEPSKAALLGAAITVIGLLLVVLSVLVADVHRPSPAPKLEIGLTVLAMANLVSVVALLTA